MARELNNKEKKVELKKKLTMVAFDADGNRVITYSGLDAIGLAREMRNYTYNCGGARVMVFLEEEEHLIKNIDHRAKIDAWIPVANMVTRTISAEDPKRYSKIA